MSRDYKKEYEEYHSLPEQKKNRAKRNKANRNSSTKPGQEVDHKVPLSQGGSNSPNNWRVVSKETNRKKGSKKMKTAGLNKLRVALLSGSTGDDPEELSRSRALAEAYRKELEAQGASVDWMDMRDMGDMPDTYDWDTEWYDDYRKRLTDADAMVISTPIFNYGPSGKVLQFLHRTLDKENQQYKPYSLLSGAGSQRSAMALGGLANQLDTEIKGIGIGSGVQLAGDEFNTETGEIDPGVVARANENARKLYQVASGMRSKRASMSHLRKLKEALQEKTAAPDGVERLPSGGIKYRGETFPGYNKPKQAPAGSKHKKRVLAKKGGKVKVVNFGARGYKHNYSAKAKKSYLARSAGIKGKDDKFSANYWSRRELWPKNQKADGSSKKTAAEFNADAYWTGLTREQQKAMEDAITSRASAITAEMNKELEPIQNKMHKYISPYAAEMEALNKKILEQTSPYEQQMNEIFQKHNPRLNEAILAGYADGGASEEFLNYLRNQQANAAQTAQKTASADYDFDTSGLEAIMLSAKK